MFGIGIGRKILDCYWRGALEDYVTAVAWSPDGKTLAASSAAGEVVLWHTSGTTAGTVSTLLGGAGQSVDCLGFSTGSLLAAGGQDGQVRIWRVPAAGAIPVSPLHSLKYEAWVDRLAWSPAGNQLAFCTGRQVRVWDAGAQAVVAALNFEASSVLDLAWHPTGECLAAAGYGGVKIWNSQNWDEDPWILDVPSATQVLAWSADGNYLACGNLDRTVAVLQWGNSHPWVMQGFPGKVRRLAWSDKASGLGAPLLAAAGGDSISVWEKQPDDFVGWDAWVLEGHSGAVGAIAFQPGTFLLASASEDGQVCLWHQVRQFAQLLEGAERGFSCLAWDAGGDKLAAGGRGGELLVWWKSNRPKGFARR